MAEFNKEVITEFKKLCEDDTTPQNIKAKIENIVSILTESSTTIEFKTSKALEELDEISEDANLPEHLRTQIWGISCILESVK